LSNKFTGRNKCTTDPIRGKRREEREERKEDANVLMMLMKILSFMHLSSFSSLLSPSYMREFKAYRRGTKSAINYLHLLIAEIWFKEGN